MTTGISLDDQIKAVGREIGLRKSVYPKFLASKRITAEKAAHEIAAMEAVYETLKKLKADQARPDPLGQALNEGDGSYRP